MTSYTSNGPFFALKVRCLRLGEWLITFLDFHWLKMSNWVGFGHSLFSKLFDGLQLGEFFLLLETLFLLFHVAFLFVFPIFESSAFLGAHVRVEYDILNVGRGNKPL